MGIFNKCRGKCSFSKAVMMKRKPKDMITARKGYMGNSRQKDWSSCCKKYWLLHGWEEATSIGLLIWYVEYWRLYLCRQSQYNASRKEHIATRIRGIWKCCVLPTVFFIHSASATPVAWKWTSKFIDNTVKKVNCRCRDECWVEQNTERKVISSWFLRRRYSVAR